ncbi:hypothetical protein ACIGEP_16400 [Microbacterium sp. NPDC077663]|uniref:hypothetical protein n=1 Tax=Microbacterium sp. NPDC077663 TaxID=3364189 RepID=UPI0037CA277B
MTPTHRFIAAAATLTVSLIAALALAPAAWAAASVSVRTADGAAPAADAATSITVSGTGFQSIVGGFGGVYVLFGWVDGDAWQPSAGGVVGDDYRYVPDAEAAENNGYQRFIAFPGGQTEESANAVLAEDGSWSIDMVIPGASFDSRDRDGSVSAVDCRQVTCGIITIGAHGVKNANNETFTPIAFTTDDKPATSEEAPAESPVAAAGDVRVGVESTTVQAGAAIVFTGRGFTAGEQVVASLDGGLAAVGPLTAGSQGEVAAAVQVPREVRDGTHLLTLRGAGSGAVAEVEVSVTGGTAVAAVAAVEQAPSWAIILMLVASAVSILLIVASLITAIVRAGRRRRERRSRSVAEVSA